MRRGPLNPILNPSPLLQFAEWSWITETERSDPIPAGRRGASLESRRAAPARWTLYWAADMRGIPGYVHGVG